MNMFMVTHVNLDRCEEIWGIYEDEADAERAKQRGIEAHNSYYPDDVRPGIIESESRHWSIKPIRLHRRGDSTTDFEG